MSIGILSLEIIVRVFTLTGNQKIVTDIDGDKLLKPGLVGLNVVGGLGEIKAKYSVNKQGWNSIKDYSELPSDKMNIAIVGDSYIEGFHVNVEESIGRIVESEMNNSVCVHEYGSAGANIIDYGLLFNKYIKDKYDLTFIWLNSDDLSMSKPLFMGRVDRIPEITTTDKIIENIKFIKYLKVNQKITENFSSVFLNLYRFFLNDNNPKDDKKQNSYQFNQQTLEALSKFDSTVIFVYERQFIDTNFLEFSSYPSLEIVHHLKPVNFGFDVHWNKNGRQNFANTIKTFLKTDSSKKLKIAN